ncbi:MFS transporter [Streptomyces sp. H39-S7]|uniref:MFS transporter n=1 Tax=Streptomyces sp. H39-S7 TaxID=3004357 RepID=UPI0022AEA990|nr:MFS transporter [Streptomyces sp. H39-S7]MCZ4120432.1 MFS transporter [Streptomyces sp. H39-S7]
MPESLPETTLSDPGGGPRAGRREWIGFGVLILPLLLVSMDVSALYFAVPFISRELQPSGTQQLWIFDIYGFVLAGLLITMGSLGDRIGRRKLLLMGAGAFGAASLLAAYAPSAEALIAARALLGIGGATLMPSTLALIRNLFQDAKQRAMAVGIWSGAMAGGIAIGPVLSGMLLEHFWWGSVFLINIPAMVLLLILAPLLLPEFKHPRPGRFDLLSAVLSMGTLLPVIYGIKELARDGYALVPVLAVVAGLLLGYVFVRRQRRGPDPLIDLTLFRKRAFSGSLAVNVLAMFATVGFAIFLTSHLQSVLGMSPLRAALWALVPSFVVGVTAPLAPGLAGRGINRASIMCGGFLLAAAGFCALTLVGADSPLWWLLVASSGYAAGLVMVMALVTEMVIGVAPPERAGAASALLESATELGGALGMAVLGSIGNAVYRRDVTDALPAGLSPDDLHAVRETLGSAQAVAARLPGRAGDAVLHAARDAFVGGLHAAAVGAAVVCAAAAALALYALRDVPAAPPTGAAEPAPPVGGQRQPRGYTDDSTEGSAYQSAVTRLP